MVGDDTSSETTSSETSGETTEHEAPDLHASETPDSSQVPQPSLAVTAIAWVQLAGLAAVANLAVLGVALALGADMQVELGPMAQTVGPIAVVVVTFAGMLAATFTWSLVAHQAPAFATLWVPLVWGLGLLSLGGTLGASGATTGTTLAVMHLVATAVAAHLVPRRLPR